MAGAGDVPLKLGTFRDLAHGHQTFFCTCRFRNRTAVASDPGRVHRSAAIHRARRQADDVELEDVRLPALPGQLQDRRRQARPAPAGTGQVQQVPGHGPGRLTALSVAAPQRR